MTYFITPSKNPVMLSNEKLSKEAMSEFWPTLASPENKSVIKEMVLRPARAAMITMPLSNHE